MITCKHCSVEKKQDEFPVYKVVDGRKYYRGSCTECYNTAHGVRRSLNTEYRREYRLQLNYGISREQFEELAKDGCAVCGTKENLCVDHDHACCPGKVTCGECIRGILCNRHNMAEGWLNGNADEAIALAAYMMTFEKAGDRV